MKILVLLIFTTVLLQNIANTIAKESSCHCKVFPLLFQNNACVVFSLGFLRYFHPFISFYQRHLSPRSLISCITFFFIFPVLFSFLSCLSWNLYILQLSSHREIFRFSLDHILLRISLYSQPSDIAFNIHVFLQVPHMFLSSICNKFNFISCID